MFTSNEFQSNAKAKIQSQPNLYYPLEVTSFLPSSKRNNTPAMMTIKWQGKEISFQVDIRPRSAPKIVQQAIWDIKSAQGKKKERILILPFLSPSVVELCTELKQNCLDLNGNYFIQTKSFLAIRLDRPNSFKESQPIKHIFSGNSSIVGRYLLQKKQTFTSVNSLFQCITKAGGSIALSTLSKVLKGLEEDLIIEKSPQRITLLQPEKLLSRLKSDYKPPRILETQSLKVPTPPINFLITSMGGAQWAQTGESSAERYGLTTAPTILSAYVSELLPSPKFEEDRFYNLLLKKTSDPIVFFNSSNEKQRWASKIQCYLELSNLDKREQEIAESIKQDILEEFR